MRLKLEPGHGLFHLLKEEQEYALEVLFTIDGS